MVTHKVIHKNCELFLADSLASRETVAFEQRARSDGDRTALVGHGLWHSAMFVVRDVISNGYHVATEPSRRTARRSDFLSVRTMRLPFRYGVSRSAALPIRRPVGSAFWEADINISRTRRRGAAIGLEMPVRRAFSGGRAEAGRRS